MIKYYPLSRIRTGFYSAGSLYNEEGKRYTGPYYLTYKGEAFEGVNPAAGSNKPLFKAPPLEDYSQTKEQRSLAASKEQALSQLVPYYPIPTEEDYTKGFINRYFAKRIVDRGYIMEISFTDWSKVSNKTDPTYVEYELEDLMWQITGPLHDTRVSQYQIQGGVYDTNKRIVEQKAKSFKGLKEFIGDNYTKFARIKA